MERLSILRDGRDWSEELHAKVAQLRDAGDVQVHVSGVRKNIDAGVPFPIAILHGEKGRGVREYGATAVLALVCELLAAR